MSWGEARGTDGEGGRNVGPPREVLLGIHIGHAFLSSFCLLCGKVSAL